MLQNYYPTVLQLEQRLFAAGVISAPMSSTDDQFDMETACAAAAESWENLTGFSPFLADTIETTHVFMPDGSPIVDLLGGFITISAVSINGNAATLNTDYRTMPLNAVVNNKPITYLKFDRNYGRFYSLYAALPGQPATVSVTGRRGAYNVLPPLAYSGILTIAMASLLGDFEYSKFRGVKSWKIGTDERVYDDKAFQRLTDSASARVAAALRAFRRIKIA